MVPRAYVLIHIHERSTCAYAAYEYSYIHEYSFSAGGALYTLRTTYT